MALALGFILIQLLAMEEPAPKPTSTLAEEGIRKSSVSKGGNEEMSHVGHLIGVLETLEIMFTFFHDGGGEHDSSKISCIE